MVQAVRGLVIELGGVLALLFLYLTVQSATSTDMQSRRDSAPVADAMEERADAITFLSDWNPGRDPRRFLTDGVGEEENSTGAWVLPSVRPRFLGQNGK